MGIYETITLRSHRFDKIIEVLEEACEKSNNYMEIEDYVGLINHIEEERNSYRAKGNRKFINELKWEEILDSFCKFLVEEKNFKEEEINEIRLDYHKTIYGG